MLRLVFFFLYPSVQFDNFCSIRVLQDFLLCAAELL